MLGIANSGERGNVSLWFARRCNLLASRRSSFSASSSVFRAALSAFLAAFAVAFFVRFAALAARRFLASFCARLASKTRRCWETALLDGLRVWPLAVGGRKGSGAASSSKEEDTPGDEELLLALVSTSEDNAASKAESSAGWVRDPLVGCDSRQGGDEPTISGPCWEPADGLRDALAWILASMAMSTPISLSLSKSPLAGRGGSVGAAGQDSTAALPPFDSAGSVGKSKVIKAAYSSLFGVKALPNNRSTKVGCRDGGNGNAEVVSCFWC